MTRFNPMTERALMARLTKAQNRPENQSQDIMTYAGWCGSREALIAHVERYEGKTSTVKLDPAKIAAAQASHEAFKARFPRA